jgi:hypothetical protein
MVIEILFCIFSYCVLALKNITWRKGILVNKKRLKVLFFKNILIRFSELSQLRLMRFLSSFFSYLEYLLHSPFPFLKLYFYELDIFTIQTYRVLSTVSVEFRLSLLSHICLIIIISIRFI